MKVKSRRPGFWDNLIPLKGGLFGAQLAGWTPGPAAKSGLGCRILADQMIEVAPSVALAADVYVPEGPGPLSGGRRLRGLFQGVAGRRRADRQQRDRQPARLHRSRLCPCHRHPPRHGSFRRRRRRLSQRHGRGGPRQGHRMGGRAALVRRAGGAVRHLLLRADAAAGGAPSPAGAEGLLRQRDVHGLLPPHRHVRRRAAAGFLRAVDGRELHAVPVRAARAAARCARW